MELFLLQFLQKGLITKTAVGPQEAYTFTAEILEGVIEKCRGIVGSVTVTRLLPTVGDHAHIRDKGHQGMRGGPSLLPGIVTTDRTLLTSVARHNRGIEIQRQPIHSDACKSQR